MKNLSSHYKLNNIFFLSLSECFFFISFWKHYQTICDPSITTNHWQPYKLSVYVILCFQVNSPIFNNTLKPLRYVQLQHFNNSQIYICLIITLQRWSFDSLLATLFDPRIVAFVLFVFVCL